MRLGPERLPGLVSAPPPVLLGEARPLNGRRVAVQQEGDGVLQLLGLRGHRPVRPGLPSQPPASAPSPTTPEQWAAAWAQAPGHTRPG